MTKNTEARKKKERKKKKEMNELEKKMLIKI